MIRILNAFLLGVVVVLLAACANSSNFGSGPLMIDTIKVVNECEFAVEDFRIHVPKTGAVVATNRILPNREFLNGVPEFPYKGNKAVLTWKYQGQEFTADVNKLNTPPPERGVATVLIYMRATGAPLIGFEQ